MAPDLNSLPPSSPFSFPRASSSTSNTGDMSQQQGDDMTSPSPRSGSISLQAAATMNAGLQREPSRRSSSSSLTRNRASPQTGRRQSQVLMNLQMNDPTVPGPGEMVGEHRIGVQQSASPQPMSGSPLMTGGDPHHNRAPSLGELHQELEAEQEAQVNRLLHMIRQQQLQIQQYQAQQEQAQASASANDAQPVPVPIPQPASGPSPISGPGQSSGSLPRSPVFPHHPRSSFDMARADLQRRSRTPSRGASPRLRSTSISGDSGEQMLLGGRDESAFYQAETQMLVRENQMLRHRIRDLERQLGDATSHSPLVTRQPAQHSHLTHSQSVSEDSQGPERGSSSAPDPASSVAESPKEE